MRIKLSLTVAGLLLLATSVASCTGVTLSNDVLVVGLECNYAPFNWTAIQSSDYTLPIEGLSGQYADGYDVQVAKFLSEKTGKDVKIKKIAWDSLIPALQTNDINCIIAGMSYTEERDLSVDFSDAYYESEIVGITLSNSIYANATSFADLSGAKIISQLSTIQDTAIDCIPNITHMTGTNTFATAALSVISHDADVMLAEKPVAQQIINVNSQLKIIEFSDSFTGIDQNALCVNVAVLEGNTSLISDINTALALLSQDTKDQLMLGALERSSI